jgi:hypothetical protein
MPRSPKEPADRLNLAGTMPSSLDEGLTPLMPSMIASHQGGGPGLSGYAVVRWWARYDKRDGADETHNVVVQFTQIEPVFDDAEKAARVLLEEAATARLNSQPGQMALTAGAE